MDRLEEGVFGMEAVKMGSNQTEPGLVVRIGRFRNALAALACVLLVVVMGTYWLARSTASAVCPVQSVELELEELEELARRLRQRELFDRFLDAEKSVEIEFRERVYRIVDSLNESQVHREYRPELRKVLGGEVEWFMGMVDQRVEQIIGPLDEEYRTIPIRIKVLQQQIQSQMPILRTCGDLSALCSSKRVGWLLRKFKQRKSELEKTAAPPVSELLEQPIVDVGLLLQLLAWGTHDDDLPTVSPTQCHKHR